MFVFALCPRSSRLNTPELLIAEVKRVGLRIQSAKPIGAPPSRRPALLPALAGASAAVQCWAEPAPRRQWLHTQRTTPLHSTGGTPHPSTLFPGSPFSHTSPMPLPWVTLSPSPHAACPPAELVIGNIVRRVLHIIREEVEAEQEEQDDDLAAAASGGWPWRASGRDCRWAVRVGRRQCAGRVLPRPAVVPWWPAVATCTAVPCGRCSAVLVWAVMLCWLVRAVVCRCGAAPSWDALL